MPGRTRRRSWFVVALTLLVIAGRSGDTGVPGTPYRSRTLAREYRVLGHLPISRLCLPKWLWARSAVFGGIPITERPLKEGCLGVRVANSETGRVVAFAKSEPGSQGIVAVRRGHDDGELEGRRVVRFTSADLFRVVEMEQNQDDDRSEDE
jgi:hypothetical protein